MAPLEGNPSSSEDQAARLTLACTRPTRPRSHAWVDGQRGAVHVAYRAGWRRWGASTLHGQASERWWQCSRMTTSPRIGSTWSTRHPAAGVSPTPCPPRGRPRGTRVGVHLGPVEKYPWVVDGHEHEAKWNFRARTPSSRLLSDRRLSERRRGRYPLQQVRGSLLLEPGPLPNEMRTVLEVRDG